MSGDSTSARVTASTVRGSRSKRTRSAGLVFFAVRRRRELLYPDGRRMQQLVYHSAHRLGDFFQGVPAHAVLAAAARRAARAPRRRPSPPWRAAPRRSASPGRHGPRTRRRRTPPRRSRGRPRPRRRRRPPPPVPRSSSRPMTLTPGRSRDRRVDVAWHRQVEQHQRRARRTLVKRGTHHLPGDDRPGGAGAGDDQVGRGDRGRQIREIRDHAADSGREPFRLWTASCWPRSIRAAPARAAVATASPLIAPAPTTRTVAAGRAARPAPGPRRQGATPPARRRR